ncbi:hypothetical protein CR513_05252, partial [Mucuna pruriens]
MSNVRIFHGLSRFYRHFLKRTSSFSVTFEEPFGVSLRLSYYFQLLVILKWMGRWAYSLNLSSVWGLTNYILVYSTCVDDHIVYKCTFCTNEVVFLGFVVGSHSVKVDEEMCKAIQT